MMTTFKIVNNQIIKAFSGVYITSNFQPNDPVKYDEEKNEIVLDLPLFMIDENTYGVDNTIIGGPYTLRNLLEGFFGERLESDIWLVEQIRLYLEEEMKKIKEKEEKTEKDVRIVEEIEAYLA